MARTSQAVKTVKVRVPSDAIGVPDELLGTTWDVPSNVANKLRWIQSQYAEQEARKRADEAAAEAALIAEQRNQEVLQQRIAEAQVEVEKEPEVQVETPSGDEALRLAASLTAVQAALLTEAEKVSELQATLDLTIQTTAEQLALVRSEGISREEAVGIAQNATALQNAAMESLGGQIRAAEGELNRLRFEVGALVAAASAAREVVRTASVLTAEVKDIARQESQQLIEKESDDFLQFLSILMKALGVDASQINQVLNSASVTGGDIFLTRNFLRNASAIARSWEATPDALADIKQSDIAVAPDAFEVPVQG